MLRACTSYHLEAHTTPAPPLSYFLSASGPHLASKASANIINILDAVTVSLSQKAVDDVCAGLLSVSTHVQSSEQRPNANTPANFSTPDLSTSFLSNFGALCSALSLTEVPRVRANQGQRQATFGFLL